MARAQIGPDKRLNTGQSIDFGSLTLKIAVEQMGRYLTGIRQEHPFNAAAAEFARVVEGLLEGETGRPVVLQRGIPQDVCPDA